MNKKTDLKSFVLITVAFLYLNCNKPEVYISEEQNKCQEILVTQPKIEITGELIYGEPLYIATVAKSHPTTPLSKIDRSYVQLPNGVVAHLSVNIESLTPQDDGEYIGYFKNEYCISEKVSVIIKGHPLTPPCSYQDNWLGGAGFPNGQISKTTKTINPWGRLEFAFFGSDPTLPIITLQINSSTIEEGIYYLQSVTRNLGSITEGRKAYVQHIIQGPPQKYLVNTSGGKLYVLKIAPKKYAFVICNEVMSNSGLSPFYELQLKAIVDE